TAQHKRAHRALQPPSVTSSTPREVRRRLPADAVRRTLTEKSGRPHDQDDEQQTEREGVAQLRRQVDEARDLAQAEDVRAEYRAGKAPHAAHDHDGERAELERQTHLGVDGVVCETKEHPGEPTES